MLIPAFVIIGFLLASIVVDQMALLMQHRELADAAQAAANDAAGAGINTDGFGAARGSDATIDLDRASRAVSRSLSARNDPLVSRSSWTIAVVPSTTDEVEVEVTIVADTHGVLFSFFDTTIEVTARAGSTSQITP
jgi:hypothetical protein